jgi:hypothetical protein
MEGVASRDHINSTSCVLIQHYKMFVKRGVEGKIVPVTEGSYSLERSVGTEHRVLVDRGMSGSV